MCCSIKSSQTNTIWQTLSQNAAQWKKKNKKKWPIAVFIETLKKLSVHYRAYSLSLTGSFNVAWKTGWAVQKDAQCELKLPSLKLIHWMPLVSPGLCKTKIRDLKTKLNVNAFSFNPLTHSGLVHQLNESISTFRGEWCTSSLFITFRIKIPVANSVDSDQTPRFAVSNLGLHCWQRSQRWVTRHKRLI